MVRIDMSEYMEKHAVSRLIGAPPGYVGYEEGGQLSEAIRRRPYSVVLLDEVEKAHKDVFNILLQVLDDGRITDSQGRVVDFRNTIIVMTSNVGSEIILNLSGDDTKYEQMREKVTGSLRKRFRPEFLNRIDELIIFHTLRRDELKEIVKLQIKRIEKLLADQKISLQLTDAALDHVVESGYDPTFGARPLKRAIQRELENPISTKILEAEFADGDRVVADCADGALVFTKEAKPVIEEDIPEVTPVVEAEPEPEIMAEPQPEETNTVEPEAPEIIEAVEEAVVTVESEIIEPEDEAIAPIEVVPTEDSLDDAPIDQAEEDSSAIADETNWIDAESDDIDVVPTSTATPPEPTNDDVTEQDESKYESDEDWDDPATDSEPALVGSESEEEWI